MTFLCKGTATVCTIRKIADAFLKNVKTSKNILQGKEQDKTINLVNWLIWLVPMTCLDIWLRILKNH